MMSRTLKKKLLPTAMAVALAGGFSLNVSAIHLAEDGVGQVLLTPMQWSGAPLVTTSEGISLATGKGNGLTEGVTMERIRANNPARTQYVITNTREDTAVKVKVVFRSKLESTECIDFICYMSPGDVCRFESGLLDNPSNPEYVTGVYSNDDSVLSLVPEAEFNLYPNRADTLLRAETVFGSQRAFEQSWPYDRNGVNAPDTCDMGHVEAFAAYAVQGTVVGYNNAGVPQAIEITRGMSKYDLAKVFDTPRTSDDFSTMLHESVARNVSLALANNGNIAVTRELMDRQGQTIVGGPISALSPLDPFDLNPPTSIRSTDPDWVRLMGTATVSMASDRFSYSMSALSGAIGDRVENIPYIDPNGANIFGFANSQGLIDGLVVSNPLFDVSVAEQSSLGVNFGVSVRNSIYPGTIEDPQSKVVEIEQALATTDLQSDYELSGNNETWVGVTFPTRYLHLFNDPCNTGFVPDVIPPIVNRVSPPFSSDGTVSITTEIFDDFENKGKRTGGIIISPNIETPDFLKLVETNYFQPEWIDDFKRGWFDINLQSINGCPYPGLPALGFTHKYIEVNGISTQSVATPMAH